MPDITVNIPQDQADRLARGESITICQPSKPEPRTETRYDFVAVPGGRTKPSAHNVALYFIEGGVQRPNGRYATGPGKWHILLHASNTTHGGWDQSGHTHGEWDADRVVVLRSYEVPVSCW